ncbi:MAG: alginate export family protein, partial [Thermodesulfobacteriota bacterium]
ATAGTSGILSDQDTDLWAVYAEIKAIPNNQLDLYALLLRDGATGAGLGAALTPNKPDSLYTIGARLAGKVPAANVDYTVEIPFQFGDTGTQLAGTDGSYGGYAIFAKAGYTIPGATKVRLGAEYNFISGDDQNTGDSDQDAYINMKLGTDHMNYGYMDINNPSGALGNGGKSLWSLNAKAQVTPDLSLYVAYWNATINEVTTGASDDNGAEIDLQAVYKVSTGTKLVAGYGNYSPGDAQRVNGDNQDWAFLMLKAAF